jgi:hypothetical protein
MMSWLAWTWATAIPVALGIGCAITGLRMIWLKCQIRHIEEEIDSASAELLALEGLTPEDRAWLASFSDMTEPRYVVPPIDSIWEWRTGDPQTREVVKVEMTVGPDGGGPAGSVLLVGPSGDRWVSLVEFYRDATPAPLRGQR